jgi:hypothetical protein
MDDGDIGETSCRLQGSANDVELGRLAKTFLADSLTFYVHRPQKNSKIHIYVSLPCCLPFLLPFRLMSLPRLGSCRCSSTSFIVKHRIKVKEGRLYSRHFHNNVVNADGDTNVWTAPFTWPMGSNRPNEPDPLAYGQKAPLVRRELTRRREEHGLDGFSASEAYHKPSVVRPEQVLHVKGLNGNLIPQDFSRTIGNRAMAYIRGNAFQNFF